MSHILYQKIPSITEIDHALCQKGIPFGKIVRQQVERITEQLRQQLRYYTTERATQTVALPEYFESKNSLLEFITQEIRKQLNTTSQPVINATGVVLHTNLGRAPIAPVLIEEAIPYISSYSNLEFDLESGTRGKRETHARSLLCSLTGCEDAVIVNNNAAALYLILKALTEKREVLVSRGELVEIGGSFRIPDIMKEANVCLKEVGTTNRTRLADYSQAITENTAALLKVHPSNYSIEGFTEEVTLPNLAQLARQQNLLSLSDWGSATFYQFQNPHLRSYPTVQQLLESEVDILAFSGDKLLGSVQAGIILGKFQLLARIRHHPLYRIVRMDKMNLRLLEATLAIYHSPQTAREKIPILGMLEQSEQIIEQRAQKVKKQLPSTMKSSWQYQLKPTVSATGGGGLPNYPLPSIALVLTHKDKSANWIQEQLRLNRPSIIARIQEGQVWLDFRTITDEQVFEITTSLARLLKL